MEFSYKAKNRAGKVVVGKTIAENEEQARKDIAKQDLFVLSIKNKKHHFLSELSFKKQVSAKDKIIFTRELAIMIRGGLPLIDALSTLEEQTENLEFKRVIKVIATDVRGGLALSKALAKHPQVFPDLYIAVTTSGERSGKLDEVLNRLSEQLQKDYDLTASVKNAITYPSVVIATLIMVVILMLIFVVPKMRTIFNDMGVALPLATRMLLSISSFVINYWYVILIIIVGLFLFIRFWNRTVAGGLAFDKMKIKIPIFGNLIKKIYLARFTRTTATLIASGLPMLEIIETDRVVVGNKYYEPIFDQIHQDVEGGVPLSLAMKKHKIFPVMISQMISVGEKSGKIDEMLLQLADFYDKEVAAITSNMAALIEPILMVIIGIGVGAAIIAIIMPIYSLVNVV